MNGLNYQARKLLAECSTEEPSLQIIEALCGINFETFCGLPDRWKPVFEDTDSNSGSCAKATYLAYNWLLSQAKESTSICVLCRPNKELHFEVDFEKFEVASIVSVLKHLHHIQLRKDSYFMENLKDKFKEWQRKSESELLDENPLPGYGIVPK